jgi:hypothetical protein
LTNFQRRLGLRFSRYNHNPKMTAMKSVSRRILFVMLVSLLLIPVDAQAVSQSAPKKYTAKELIAKIIESEKKIHDVELHFERINAKDKRVLSSLDWGYERGKEYCAGILFASPEPARNIPAWDKKIRYVFDGERLYSLQEKVSFRNGQVLKEGWLGGIRPFSWSYFKRLQPTYWLGYMLFPGRCTLGEILRDAPSVTVRENPQVIEGHSCSVIEAVGIIYGHLTADLRVWVDMKRDFRPLKFEKYKSLGGGNRWKVLIHSMDKIKLEKIDGIWFPIDGRAFWFYTKKIMPPKGMTVTEFRRIPIEKGEQLARYIQVPSKNSNSKARINKETIRINKGIDPKKFTIEFPPGCEMWDDFRKVKYTIGKRDSDVEH